MIKQNRGYEKCYKNCIQVNFYFLRNIIIYVNMIIQSRDKKSLTLTEVLSNRKKNINIIKCKINI